MMLKKKIIGLTVIETTLFFAILFFIVKCVFISVKYLKKFGTKHVWIYLFQSVMWRLTSHWLIKKLLSLKLHMKSLFSCHIMGQNKIVSNMFGA